MKVFNFFLWNIYQKTICVTKYKDMSQINWLWNIGIYYKHEKCRNKQNNNLFYL